MNAICSALSSSEFSRISNCETAKEAWDILETTYEGTKLVKSARLQTIVSNEFYDRINDVQNSMISLEKKVFDAKLI